MGIFWNKINILHYVVPKVIHPSLAFFFFDLKDVGFSPLSSPLDQTEPFHGFHTQVFQNDTLILIDSNRTDFFF